MSREPLDLNDDDIEVPHIEPSTLTVLEDPLTLDGNTTNDKEEVKNKKEISNIDFKENEIALSVDTTPIVKPSDIVIETPIKVSSPRESPVMTPEIVGNIKISITDYEKRGDGIGAYLVYRIVTKVDGIKCYNHKEYEVYRRFSDFLGLREKLHIKYQVYGIIIPQAPEKSIAAMAKTKVNPSGGATDEHVQIDIAEKRMRGLQRFLQRVVKHPRLVIDCDVRDFLTMSGDLIKANFTSAISGNSVKKVFKTITETFSKLTLPMDENDRWFETAQTHLDENEDVFFRLQAILEHLVSSRKSMAHSQESLSKQLALLSSCEENTSLSRALSKLAETKECLSQIETQQVVKDSAILLELIQEHLSLINVTKETFYERVKTWQNLQAAQASLARKRELKTKLELQGKADKAAGMRDELKEAENRVDDFERDFKDISKYIRMEYNRFVNQRMVDIKEAIIEYLESLVLTQERTLNVWQKMVSETASIIP
uniref:FI18122p1 (inferred by orthology to a D. melanogaster protein) n=1 Tax=Strongyloides venezuelensis TaxID=75913 RepID=A0A0K0G036_STRVS